MNSSEFEKHLTEDLIPYWMNLTDNENGGYYGYVDFYGNIDKKAAKGCILNSRILWFFSNAYTLLSKKYGEDKCFSVKLRNGVTGWKRNSGNSEGSCNSSTEGSCSSSTEGSCSSSTEGSCCSDSASSGCFDLENTSFSYSVRELLSCADHAYRFLADYCLDPENGGVYWSMNYNGTVEDSTKHTYNQAFAVYALSSYYEASGQGEALLYANSLFDIIENRCTDRLGYCEAFTADFKPAENDKLSENGVIAEKTMNTLLHVFEAYSELFRIAPSEKTASRLKFILEIYLDKIYNPSAGRQEVFFDREYNSLIDLNSYGHDIEAAWLMWRGACILGDSNLIERLRPVSLALSVNIYRNAFDGHSLANECENGKVDNTRIWWVQAETVLGFINAWELDNTLTELRDGSEKVWEYIQKYVIDKNLGEWYWNLSPDGTPIERSITDPWKCPYHNGRMCMEMIRRNL